MSVFYLNIGIAVKENILRRFIRWYKRPNKNFIEDTLESLIVVLPAVFLIKTVVFGLYQVPTCSMETTMLVGERFFADKATPYFKAPQRNEIISFNNPAHKFSDNPVINWYQQYMSWSVLNYTKRVIGVPGDHVQGKVENGKPVVYLNGEKLDEPYLNRYPIIVRYKNGEFHHRSYDPAKPLDDQPFYDMTQAEIARGKMYYGEQHILYPDTPACNAHGIKDEYDVYLKDHQYWCMGDNRQGSFDSRDWGPLDTSKTVWHGRIVFRIWSLDSDESWWIVDLIKHPIDFWHRVRWSRFFQFLK